MRTTLTLDDDVHALLVERARRERRPLRDVINELLRSAVAAPGVLPRYEMRVQHGKLVSGIDPDRLNQLADELEDEALAARMGRGR